MIRLTVLYNLPPGTSEADFLDWRLTDHQTANAAIQGVVRTDFAQVVARFPGEMPLPYRFMTIAEWEDRESFERGFYNPQVQAALAENLKTIADPLFLVSEVLTETRNRE
jgi:heme-degrading monooxygenase HmoA